MWRARGILPSSVSYTRGGCSSSPEGGAPTVSTLSGLGGEHWAACRWVLQWVLPSGCPVFQKCRNTSQCKSWGFLGLPLSPTVTCLSQSSRMAPALCSAGPGPGSKLPLSSRWPSKLGPNREGADCQISACLPSLWLHPRPVLLLGWPGARGQGNKIVAAVFLPEQSLLLTGRGLAPRPSGEWAGCEVWLQNSGAEVCKTTRPSCSSCRGPRRGQGWPSSSLHRSLLEIKQGWFKYPESINYGQKITVPGDWGSGTPARTVLP